MGEPKLAETDAARASLYESDFYRWTEQMSARLRNREAGELDWENLAEEIDSLGGRERRDQIATPMWRPRATTSGLCVVFQWICALLFRHNNGQCWPPLPA